jgi:hypothetical protein
VVEASSLIYFAPFNYSLPNLKFLFDKATFSISENKFKSVYDFSEGKNINDSPHWKLLENNEFSFRQVQVIDTGCSDTQLNKKSLTNFNENDLLYNGYFQELFSLGLEETFDYYQPTDSQSIPSLEITKNQIINPIDNVNPLQDYNDLNRPTKNNLSLTAGINFEQGADLLSSNKSSPETASNNTVGSSDYVVVDTYQDKFNNDNFVEISKAHNNKPTKEIFKNENPYEAPHDGIDYDPGQNFKEIYEKDRLIKLKTLMEEELKNKSQLINNARDFIERFERYK